jgi:hypothetical protein
MREPWSLQDVRRLRELAQAGVPLESIAATLGRTCAAVRNKAGFHAISLRGIKLTAAVNVRPTSESSATHPRCR